MNRRNAIKVAMVVVIAAAFTAIYFTPMREHMTREGIRDLVAQLRGLWYGPIVFVFAYAIGCVIGVPASVFVLSSGVIWGWKVGGSYAMVGGLLGATASFFVGRFVGEGMLQRFGRVGRAVEAQMANAGFKSLLVLRLIPLFPFAVINYGAGVGRVRYLPFFLATLVGLAPSNYVFSYSADALFNGTLSEGDALKRLFTVAALLLAVVLIPALIKKMMQRRSVPPRPTEWEEGAEGG